MPKALDLSQLDDQTVLLIFSRLTQELRSQLSEEQVDATSEKEDSRRLIATVAGEFAEELNQPGPITHLPQSANAGAVARQVLPLLAQDNQLRPKIAALVDRPPRGKPAPLEPSEAVPVILSTVAAWMQARIPIEIRERKDEVEFDVHLEQSSVNISVLQDVTKAALEIIRSLG